MSTYQLINQIEILNPIPWIKGMVVNTMSDVIEDATNFEGKLFYVKNKANKFWYLDANHTPRKITDLVFQTVNNIDSLKALEIRTDTMVCIVKCFDLNEHSSVITNNKLVQFNSIDLSDVAWHDLNNWVIIGGNVSDSNEIATLLEVIAGVDNVKIVTPYTLNARGEVKNFTGPITWNFLNPEYEYLIQMNFENIDYGFPQVLVFTGTIENPELAQCKISIETINANTSLIRIIANNNPTAWFTIDIFSKPK